MNADSVKNQLINNWEDLRKTLSELSKAIDTTNDEELIDKMNDVLQVFTDFSMSSDVIFRNSVFIMKQPTQGAN
jgi:hypothetical protein